jgi:hypothetical protein
MKRRYFAVAMEKRRHHMQKLMRELEQLAAGQAMEEFVIEIRVVKNGCLYSARSSQMPDENLGAGTAPDLASAIARGFAALGRLADRQRLLLLYTPRGSERTHSLLLGPDRPPGTADRAARTLLNRAAAHRTFKGKKDR